MNRSAEQTNRVNREVRELCNWIRELSNSKIFPIAGGLAVLESSIIK